MDEGNEHKVLVSFKCSPALRLALCEQAEKMGVTLSSHVENIAAYYKSKDKKIKELADTVRVLEEKVAFYENPFLQELYERFKGQNVSFYDREGYEQTLTIDGIKDAYTVIINSFKIDR